MDLVREPTAISATRVSRTDVVLLARSVRGLPRAVRVIVIFAASFVCPRVLAQAVEVEVEEEAAEEVMAAVLPDTKRATTNVCQLVQSAATMATIVMLDRRVRPTSNAGSVEEEAVVVAEEAAAAMAAMTRPLPEEDLAVLKPPTASHPTLSLLSLLLHLRPSRTPLAAMSLPLPLKTASLSLLSLLLLLLAAAVAAAVAATGAPTEATMVEIMAAAEAAMEVPAAAPAAVAVVAAMEATEAAVAQSTLPAFSLASLLSSPLSYKLVSSSWCSGVPYTQPSPANMTDIGIYESEGHDLVMINNGIQCWWNGN